MDVEDGLVADVDPQDLTEMLGNLFENAVKWASAKVEVAAAAEAGMVRLTVADNGPGIAPDSMQTALLRGIRLDETQPGSGLGLAIVSDLTETYGASLALGRSPLGGLQAGLRLPTRH